MIVTLTLNPAIDQTSWVNCLKPGLVNLADGSVKTPGGKGVNVARVLADLGETVTASGLLGRASRPFFESYLDKHNILNGFMEVDGETRTNIKLVNRSDSAVTDINFTGFTASAADLKQLLIRLEEYPEKTLVMVGGSLPQGISSGDFVFFLNGLKEMKFRLAIDCSGEALREAVKVQPEIIKPNIHELKELMTITGSSTKDERTYARQLVNQGIDHVVLSCGSKGAWFFSQDSELFARPGPVDLVSPVGAGDSMMAGYLYALPHQYIPEERARLATAAAMTAVSQPGVGLSSREHLQATMRSVDVLTSR